MLERAQDLFATMRIGAVRVAVHRRYRLAEASRAQSDLEARRTVGSSILLREEGQGLSGVTLEGLPGA
jgi:hypothetical protein